MKPTKTSPFSPDIEMLLAAERVVIDQPDEVRVRAFLRARAEMSNGSRRPRSVERSLGASLKALLSGRCKKRRSWLSEPSVVRRQINRAGIPSPVSGPVSIRFVFGASDMRRLTS